MLGLKVCMKRIHQRVLYFAVRKLDLNEQDFDQSTQCAHTREMSDRSSKDKMHINVRYV